MRVSACICPKRIRYGVRKSEYDSILGIKTNTYEHSWVDEEYEYNFFQKFVRKRRFGGASYGSFSRIPEKDEHIV